MFMMYIFLRFHEIIWILPMILIYKSKLNHIWVHIHSKSRNSISCWDSWGRFMFPGQLFKNLQIIHNGGFRHLVNLSPNLKKKKNSSKHLWYFALIMSKQHRNSRWKWKPLRNWGHEGKHFKVFGIFFFLIKMIWLLS